MFPHLAGAGSRRGAVQRPLSRPGLRPGRGPGSLAASPAAASPAAASPAAALPGRGVPGAFLPRPGPASRLVEFRRHAVREFPGPGPVVPLLHQGERALLEFLHQAAHPGQFRFLHGQVVLVLEQEQAGEPGNLGELGPFLRECLLQGLDPVLEHVAHLGRRKHRHLREGRLELRVFLDRGAEQLGEPVLQLRTALLGEAVHGALRTPALAAGLHGLDEAVLGQVVHHGVQGAVVQLDAALLALGAHGRGHLVRMHRPLAERGQHGEGQGIGHPPPLARHGTTLLSVSVYP